MESKNLTFEEALTFLKQGYRVSRSGWNGKGMWLIFVEKWSCSTGNLPDNYSGHAPFIAIFTADGALVPWFASQADMLAADWVATETKDQVAEVLRRNAWMSARRIDDQMLATFIMNINEAVIANPRFNVGGAMRAPVDTVNGQVVASLTHRLRSSVLSCPSWLDANRIAEELAESLCDELLSLWDGIDVYSYIPVVLDRPENAVSGNEFSFSLLTRYGVLGRPLE